MCCEPEGLLAKALEIVHVLSLKATSESTDDCGLLLKSVDSHHSAQLTPSEKKRKGPMGVVSMTLLDHLPMKSPPEAVLVCLAPVVGVFS